MMMYAGSVTRATCRMPTPSSPLPVARSDSSLSIFDNRPPLHCRRGTHTVDLLHIAADLLFFVEVRRADGTVENGATVCADILTLPTACDSTYTLYYHRAPRPLSDADTTEADIPRGCEHLLALLTASYLYLDDEPERAQYYLSLYRDGMLRLTQTATHSHALPYRDVIGW